MIDTDTGMFICKVVIGVCLIIKVILGLIQDHRNKKVISVSSRGTGTVDKDGNIQDYTLDGYDIVK